MSEESPPKLRLKPKLALDSVPLPQNSALGPSGAENPAAEEPKLIRLKPRFSPDPEPPVKPDPVPEPASISEIPVAEAPVPVAEPNGPASSPEVEKPAAKFSLKPKALATPMPFEAPPEENATDETMPPPPFADADEQLIGEVPDAQRALTSRPFPPPPANFPPPPSSGGHPGSSWVHPSGSAAPKGKSFRIVGGVIAALIILGGAFFAYRKFMAPAAEPQPKPEVAVDGPAVPEVKREEPARETPAPESIAKPATAEEVAPAEPVAAAPLPPPPPTVAFRAWVENLRISGVRAGSSPRAFIDGTAYEAGEVVNPRLGIIFESYNAETRKLVFRDGSGATVERRN